MQSEAVNIIHAVHSDVDKALLIRHLSPGEECELDVSIGGVAVKIQEDRSGLTVIRGRNIHIIAPPDLALMRIGHSDLKPVEASDLVIWGEAATRAGVTSMPAAHCDKQQIQS